jgi:uncharacterized membrane protein
MTRATPAPTPAALAAIVAAAVALVAAGGAAAQFRGVKCYGITKAGQNDCAHARGYHLCSGEALVDYDGGDWKLVKSAAECEARSGSTKPFDGANPKPPKP